MQTNSNSHTHEIDLYSLPAASFVKRVMSLTYDTLVLAGISLVYGMIGFALKEIVFGAVPDGEVPKGGPLLFIGWMVVLVGFYAYFWLRAGQTVGMRAWRLKIICSDNAELSTMQIISRYLLRCAVAILGFALLGVGYFWCLFDKNGDTLHDKLSRTRIVALPLL